MYYLSCLCFVYTIGQDANLNTFAIYEVIKTAAIGTSYETCTIWKCMANTNNVFLLKEARILAAVC